MRYSIVCAVNNQDVLKRNLLASELIKDHDICLKFNYTSITKAYNDALREVTNDVIIFVHQDVALPDTFFAHLTKEITNLKNINWGVLGVAGMTSMSMSACVMDRGTRLITNDVKPTKVRTLDELLLVIKKSSFDKIKFDENIKNQHLFGTDICLQALKEGMTNWVVDAYCRHNSSAPYELPLDFYEPYQYLKEKWASELPIRTTCTIIE